MADTLRTDAIPPFLTKTYDMVDNPATDAIISWSNGNNSFVVWNPVEFAQELLPKSFKHNNFFSFVRQLNTYGFRKVDPNRYEFAHEGFLRGRPDLLKRIQRRRRSASHNFDISQQLPQQHQGCQISDQSSGVEVGNQVALEREIERLKNDKNVLAQELVKLHQLQQNTAQQLQAMEQRLLATENKQQQMMSFLAKALQNPRFLAQLVQQSESNNNRLATMGGRKRRFLKHDIRSEEHMLDEEIAQPQGQIVPYYNNQPSNSDVNLMETNEAVLIQFLDSIEASLFPMSPDSERLDVLFRSSPSHPETITLSNQQVTGVTVTELDMSGLAESLPVTNPLVGNIAPLGDQELLDLQAPPASQTSGLETGALSLEIDSSLNPTKKTNTETGQVNNNENNIGASNSLETNFCDGEGMSSNIGSPAANRSDIFWEQFFSGSPAIVDPLDLVPSKIDFGAIDKIPELSDF